MKKYLFSFLAAVAIATAIPARAQKAGLYTLLNAVPVAAVATNTYTISSNIMVACYEYDHVGLTWTVASTTNSSTVLRISQSFDGGNTLEANPMFVQTIAASGSGIKTYATNLTTFGATHLYITALENGTAGGSTTNTVQVYLKSPKLGARQATQ